jgi:hypothetical protein
MKTYNRPSMLRNHFLDSLANGSEDEVQIMLSMNHFGVIVSIEEVRTMIAKMLSDGFICKETNWVGEAGTMYKMTEKGWKYWNKIPADYWKDISASSD